MVLNTQRINRQVQAPVLLASLGAVYVCVSLATGQMFPSLFGIFLVIGLWLIKREPYDVMLLWVLISPAFDWWGGIELGSLPNITPHRLLLGVTIVSLLLRRSISDNPVQETQRKPEVVLLGLYLAYSTMMIIMRVDSFEEVFGLFQTTLLPALAFLIPFGLITNEQQVLRLFRWMPLIVVYLFLPALYEQITKTSFLPGGWLWGVGMGYRGFRSSSLSGQASTLSNMGLLLIPFMIYRFSKDRQRLIARVWDYLLLAFAGGIVLCSYFRSAMIALAFVLLLAVIGVPKMRKTVLPSLLIIAAVLVWQWNNIAETDLFQQRMLNPLTGIERLENVNTQMKRLLANPLFGEGGSEALLISGTTTVSHNFYMSLALHTGLIGLVLYLAPIAVIVLRTGKWLRSSTSGGLLSRKRDLVIILWLSVIGMMINGMFMDLRFFGTALALFWFILGMIARITAWPQSDYDVSARPSSAPRVP